MSVFDIDAEEARTLRATSEPEDDLRPTRAEAARDALDDITWPMPDPRPCDDPWCPSSVMGRHQHGTRPDGVRGMSEAEEREDRQRREIADLEARITRHEPVWETADAGHVTTAVLLTVLFVLGFVGLFCIAQHTLCEVHDNVLSQCEAQR